MLLPFISMLRLPQNRPVAAHLFWLMCLLGASHHSCSILYFLMLYDVSASFCTFSASARKLFGSLSLSQRNPGFFKWKYLETKILALLVLIVTGLLLLLGAFRTRKQIRMHGHRHKDLYLFLFLYLPICMCMYLCVFMYIK